jgi:hypothetical protein
MGPRVHLTLTRRWAIDEGFTQDEAELIARANVTFDSRFPARSSLGNMSRHFAPTAWLWSAWYLGRARRWRDPLLLGYALHCAQDGVAHGRMGTRHLSALAFKRASPDMWEEASAGVQRRTEQVTRARLQRYRRQMG